MRATDCISALTASTVSYEAHRAEGVFNADPRPAVEFIRFLRTITDELIMWMINLIGGYHAIRYSLRLHGKKRNRATKARTSARW